MAKKAKFPKPAAPLPLQGKELFGEEFWQAVDAAIETGISQKREVALPPELLKEVVARPIGQDELEHLQQVHAYLAITNSAEPVFEPVGEPTLVRASSGWLIYDYGNFMIASAGLFAYGYHPDALKQKAINDDDEGGKRGRDARDYSRTGTIVQQIVDTSKDMLGLVQQRWPAAKMVAGYPGMQRMAWVVATLNNYPIVDFEPTIEDRVVLEWARRNGVDKLRVKDIVAEHKARRAPGQQPQP